MYRAWIRQRVNEDILQEAGRRRKKSGWTGATLSFFLWRRAGMTEAVLSFEGADERMWFVTAGRYRAWERFEQMLGDAGL